MANKIDLVPDEPVEETDGETIAAPRVPGTRTRQVSREEAELWAKEEGLLYMETSAKTGQNVDEVDILNALRVVLN